MHLSDMSGRAVLHLHILPKRPGEAKQISLGQYDSTSPPVSKLEPEDRLFDFRACSGPDCGAKDRDREFACASQTCREELFSTSTSSQNDLAKQNKLHLDSTTQHLLPCPRLEPDESAL